MAEETIKEQECNKGITKEVNFGPLTTFDCSRIRNSHQIRF